MSGGTVDQLLSRAGEIFQWPSATAPSTSSNGINTPTPVTNATNWVQTLPSDNLVLTGSSLEDSYWQTGVLIEWDESTGRKSLILDKGFWFLDVQNHQSMQQLPNEDFTMGFTPEAYVYLDVPNIPPPFNKDSTFTYNVAMVMDRSTLNGYSKLAITANAPANNTTPLFGGWTGEAIGPFHASIDVLVIQEQDLADPNKQFTQVLTNFNVFSAPIDFSETVIAGNTLNITTDSLLKLSLGVTNNNQVNLGLKFDGGDLLTVFTGGVGAVVDAVAGGATDGDPRIKSTSLKEATKNENSAISQVLKKVGGTLAKGIGKLMEVLEVSATIDMGLAISALGQASQQITTEYTRSITQQYDTHDTIEMVQNQQYSVVFHDQLVPLTGMQIHFVAGGFGTSQRALNDTQRAFVSAKWDGLEARVREKILEPGGVASIKAFGSASNLGDDALERDRAADRADNLLDYLCGPDIMGPTSVADALKSSAEKFDHPAPEGDDSERFRYAEVIITLN